MGARPLADAVQLRIEADVRRGVSDGSLYPGMELASLRKTATTYQTTHATVSRAFDHLVEDGILVNRGRAGFAVAREPRIERSIAAKTAAFVQELRDGGYPEGLLQSMFAKILASNDTQPEDHS